MCKSSAEIVWKDQYTMSLAASTYVTNQISERNKVLLYARNKLA